MMADTSSPKITGESVLSECDKHSGGSTGRSLYIIEVGFEILQVRTI